MPIDNGVDVGLFDNCLAIGVIGLLDNWFLNAKGVLGKLIANCLFCLASVVLGRCFCFDFSLDKGLGLSATPIDEAERFSLNLSECNGEWMKDFLEGPIKSIDVRDRLLWSRSCSFS